MPAIGPGPYCGMLLADLGADVLRIDRVAQEPGVEVSPAVDFLGRGKRSLALDLKAPDAKELVLGLLGKADIVIEGFRPGTMERLGLGPDVALARNPRLIYGRMTGWGQQGPLSHSAGHDINYLALTGALHAIGRNGEAPVPPLNLVADYGGGALFLLVGVLAALQERQRSGLGQVVDAAMVDGASSLMTSAFAKLAQGKWNDERGSNVLDGAAPWYDSYRCADGRYICVGAIEPQFFAQLCQRIGLPAAAFPNHLDRSRWAEIRKALTEIFATRTREEWSVILEGTDSCFAPVLALHEAAHHPHLVARNTFIELDEQLQPAPAPRFSRTPCLIDRPAPQHNEGGREVLEAWGVLEKEMRQVSLD